MAKKDPNKVLPYVFRLSENDALLLALELSRSTEYYSLQAKKHSERGEDVTELLEASAICARMASQLRECAVMG